jgi:hypothetical protein
VNIFAVLDYYHIFYSYAVILDCEIVRNCTVAFLAMPKCFGFWSSFFRAFDLFPNPKLLRYNGEPEYTSTSGGIISLGVIVIFIILFASEGLRTVERAIIFSTSSTQSEIDPSELTTTLGPQGDTMIAAFVYGVNLSAVPRMFTVEMSQEFYYSGYIPINSTNIPLEPCTQAHFNFGGTVKQIGQKIPLSEGLCPPIGQ